MRMPKRNERRLFFTIPKPEALCASTAERMKFHSIMTVYTSDAPGAVKTARSILRYARSHAKLSLSKKLSDYEFITSSLNSIALYLCEQDHLSGAIGLAKVMHNRKNISLHERIRFWANETATFVRKVSRIRGRRNILIVSHEVIRIESALQVLLGEEIHEPERIIKNSEVIIAILNLHTGFITELEWVKVN